MSCPCVRFFGIDHQASLPIARNSFWHDHDALFMPWVSTTPSLCSNETTMETSKGTCTTCHFFITSIYGWQVRKKQASDMLRLSGPKRPLSAHQSNYQTRMGLVWMECSRRHPLAICRGNRRVCCGDAELTRCEEPTFKACWQPLYHPNT